MAPFRAALPFPEPAYTEFRLVFFLLLHFFFSFPSHLLSSPFFFSLPPRRKSDPGSHSKAGSSPPLPTTVRALRSYREKVSAAFFPRRLSSNCAYPRYALSAVHPSFFVFGINSKSHHGGIRTHGPTLVAFEGYHY